MTIDQYADIFFQLDLDLKDRSSGNFNLSSCIYPAGTRFSFISNNYFAKALGFEPREIISKKEYRYYDLFMDNHRMMSSSPNILFTQYIPYIKAKGNVLLGGYGLGILAKMLCEKDNVDSVTSFEYYSDIIELCRFNDSKLNLIHGDFYKYLKENDFNKYDYIYIDTFTSNDDNIYPEIIIPIKRFLLENYPTIPFDFWQEDEFKAKYIESRINKENIF